MRPQALRDRRVGRLAQAPLLRRHDRRQVAAQQPLLRRQPRDSRRLLLVAWLAAVALGRHVMFHCYRIAGRVSGIVKCAPGEAQNVRGRSAEVSVDLPESAPRE